MERRYVPQMLKEKKMKLAILIAISLMIVGMIVGWAAVVSDTKYLQGLRSVQDIAADGCKDAVLYRDLGNDSPGYCIKKGFIETSATDCTSQMRGEMTKMQGEPK